MKLLDELEKLMVPDGPSIDEIANYAVEVIKATGKNLDDPDVGEKIMRKYNSVDTLWIADNWEKIAEKVQEIYY